MGQTFHLAGLFVIPDLLLDLGGLLPLLLFPDPSLLLGLFPVLAAAAAAARFAEQKKMFDSLVQFDSLQEQRLLSDQEA